MNRPAAVPRVRARARHHAVLRVKPPLKFAILEFLGKSDSTRFRALMRRYKWKDVSPIWGSSKVNTFKNSKAVIDQWPKFQEGIVDAVVDWYFVSGHHGRVFGNDDLGLNVETNCGFFNEWYYDNRWAEASYADPGAGIHPLEIYMDSTRDVTRKTLNAYDNPIFAKKRDKCRGAILIACNTLSYKVSRQAWNRRLPNAVVIGKTSTCPGGTTSWDPIRKVCRRSFFEDPKSMPPDELCAKLNKAYKRPHGFGVLSEGRLYFNKKVSGKWRVRDIAVDDDYP